MCSPAPSPEFYTHITNHLPSAPTEMSNRCHKCNMFQSELLIPHLSYPWRVPYPSIAQHKAMELSLTLPFFLPSISDPSANPVDPSSECIQNLIACLFLCCFYSVPSPIVCSQDYGNSLIKGLSASPLAFSLPHLWSVLLAAARGHL